MKHVTAADLVALFVVVVWGASYPVIKSVYHELTPLAFTQLRFIVASLLLLPAVIVGFRREEMTREDWLRTLLIGVLTVTVYQTCFSVGLLYTSASNSSLIVGSAPVFTLLFVYVARLERVHTLKAAGIFMALGGLVLLIGGADGLSLAGSGWKGDLITIGSAVGYGFSAAIARPVMERHRATFVMGVGMIVGTVALLPLGLGPMLAQDWLAVSGLSWLKLAYAAVLGASVAYVLWFWCIGKIGPTKTAAYGYFIPVTAVVLAAVLLGERMTAVGVLGAAVVLAGVTLTRWGDAIVSPERR